MQNAADDLVELMMERYNKERLTVYNTLQCYRWDRVDYLKQLHKRAKDKGFMCGMKIVRGAYMEKERERAEEKGYKSPICNTKEDTDNTFNTALRYILNNKKGFSVFVGTVIPYLIRRAKENTSVAGQTGRELTLLNKEKKRRNA